MTVQELIDKLEEIDYKSKIVCVIGVRETSINNVKESPVWEEINLVYNPMK